MNITFTNVYNLDVDYPQPASKFIPDWYKDIESYLGGEKQPASDGSTTATIKRCMPVFDAMTAGYIITTPCDVVVSIKNDRQIFDCINFHPIRFHPIEQAPNHPYKKEYPYPKWMNPWSIKTPDGYSTLFVQPFHRDSVFTIMPGIVDTDGFTANVSFPMVINDLNFEGIIKKGTPMAQVIPFKREEWHMEIGGEEEIIDKNNKAKKLLEKPFDKYKTFWWYKKNYK